MNTMSKKRTSPGSTQDKKQQIIMIWSCNGGVGSLDKMTAMNSQCIIAPLVVSYNTAIVSVYVPHTSSAVLFLKELDQACVNPQIQRQSCPPWLPAAPSIAQRVPDVVSRPSSRSRNTPTLHTAKYRKAICTQTHINSLCFSCGA